MKKIATLLCALLLVGTLSAEDLKQQIGQRGDAQWNEFLLSLNEDGMLVEPSVPASAVAGNFSRYQGKSMLFPEFRFEDFVTDRNGEKYYYYGEPEGYNFFVIKYDSRINDLLRRYSYAMGPLGDDAWELLGTIEDVYGWWGDIVRMDVQAVRIAGKAAVIQEDGVLNFVADELIDQLMDQLAGAGSDDLPKNLSAIPSGLDPLTVAKLYFHISSVERNQEVWLELLSSGNFRGSTPETRTRTWWRNMTKEGRTFFYVRTATDTDTLKKYFFQIRENGSDVGSPKPITVILEEGEWKVKSGP